MRHETRASRRYAARARSTPETDEMRGDGVPDLRRRLDAQWPFLYDEERLVPHDLEADG